MTGTVANTVPAWVPTFFGGGNTLTWSDIQGGLAPDGWGPEVLSWLAILERDEDGVALLPYLDASGSVVWYGVARSERAGRLLGEDITGFLGATYGASMEGRMYPMPLTLPEWFWLPPCPRRCIASPRGALDHIGSPCRRHLQKRA